MSRQGAKSVKYAEGLAFGKLVPKPVGAASAAIRELAVATEVAPTSAATVQQMSLEKWVCLEH